MKRNIPVSVGFVLLFQILTDVAVLLNLSPMREITGFIYLTFVPGILLPRALNLDRRDALENFVFSVGLQIALLMFIGLLMNTFLPFAGIASPLSTVPLLAIMNATTLLASLVVCTRITSSWMSDLIPPRNSILLVAIPLLSVVGALVADKYGMNSITLLMLLSVAGLIVFGIVYRKSLPRSFYPLAILAVSFALLLHSTLATNFISGYDIHGEYHVFKFTDNAAFWNASYVSFDENINKANQMLSDTILPTIYSKTTNIDATWILKILFPLLLGIVPLALYKLYCNHAHLGKKQSFLAALFLVCNSVFFDTDGFPNKQMVGEFFFVLLFLVILSTDVASFKRTLLFVIFGAGLIVSHYSMSYLFLFLISIVWIISTLGQRIVHISQRASRVTLWMMLTFSAMSFGWYIYTSARETSFKAIVDVGNQISTSFIQDFFNPSSRSSIVLRGVGLSEAASIEHQIGRIFFYAAEILIVLGVAAMLYKRNQKKIGHDYTLLAVMSLLILVMCIVVPNLASSFRAERFYQVSLLFLAPFFVLGGETFFNLVSRRTRQLSSLSLILLILIPFLLFETSFIYEVSGDYSYSVPLSKYRMDEAQLYERITDGSEIGAANWLSTNLDYSISMVYADYTSISHVLTSYGMMPAQNVNALDSHFARTLNTTRFTGNFPLVYLREVNLDEGIVTARGLPSWNLSEIGPVLDTLNVLYCNGRDTVLGGN